MRRMILMNNYPDLHGILGEISVHFANTDEDYTALLILVDCALARNAFEGEIPTAKSVEIYTQRSVNTPIGEIGRDFQFVHCWQAPRSREQAFIDK